MRQQATGRRVVPRLVLAGFGVSGCCMLAHMRAVFRWLTAALFVAVVVQVGLAGYGAFHAIHTADKASISKKTIENGFNAHAAVGTLIVVVMLVLLIVAAAGGLGKRNIQWSGGILALGILQFVLGLASTKVPALGFLHTVNALAIFTMTGLLAHRSWMKGRPAKAAPAASPTA
jgi:O-antigen ligase